MKFEVNSEQRKSKKKQTKTNCKNKNQKTFKCKTASYYA